MLDRNASAQSATARRLAGGSVAYKVTKRCFDFVASLLLSVLLSPLMLGLAIVIMVKDHGSPFYAQERVGQHGKAIRVLKFRSMKVGADRLEEVLTPDQLEEYWKEYKIQNDTRLIGYDAASGKECFGAKLRRSSLDELPQIFWNICIKGNMSFVGPRPILRSEMASHYPRRKQQRLLAYKPGLTGYWQAYARNDAGYANGRRQTMEMYYVNNASIWLDIKILFKTIPTVLNKVGV